MPQHAPNPFPPAHPAHALYETLTAARPGDAPLLPKQPYNAALTPAIAGLQKAGDLSGVAAALLHLLNDDLPAAHALAQAGEGDATADYVHQIVHRREGDFGNTRYWVARTGAHPLYGTLADLSAPHGEPAWKPAQMVTWAARGEHFAARLNDAETQRLLAWAVRNG